MDRQAFKQRMQDLKSYRENNPGKGYWDWKVDAFDDGGVNGNLVGSYSNHTGTPTMYVPVTKEYEATPDGFGEIANVHTPEVVITPQSNISLEEAVDKGRRDAAPYVGAIVAGAALPAMSSTGGLGAAMDLSGIITDPLDPTNYLGFGVIKGLKKYKNRNSNALDYHLARLFNNNENNVGTGLELANNRTGKKLTQNDVINSSQFKNSLNPKLIKDYYNAARSIGTDKVNSAIFAPLAYIRSNYRDPYFAVNGNIYKNPLANFTSKGRKYKKSTGNKITDIDESIIASHELDHAVNKPSQAGRQSVLEWFNDNSQNVYFSKNNSTELAARGTQIKDWLKMSRNRDITTDELRNAAKNYVKDTGLDNNMTEMFDKIYDWEKAAKWFSQYASAIAAPVILSNTTESFVDGGQTGDPDMEKFYQATGRSRSGRPLEEGLKPVFSLEDAANMTPIGDAISARDTYNDEAKNYRDGRIKLYQQAIEDRNASYECLIENEDALRRAVNFDKKYGTNYVKTYTKQLQNYAKSKNSPDLMQIGIKPMSANGSFDPNIPDYVFINSDYVKNGKLQPGLISHEKSHYDNQKAGALSLPIFDNRFVDTKKTKTMYPKTYDWIQRYLHNFEETKTHMNEFRTNMINKNLLKPDSKVGLKQIKDLIFNSDNDNMKKLFNTYKSKRQFVKDFNSVPITSNGNNKTLV